MDTRLDSRVSFPDKSQEYNDELVFRLKTWGLEADHLRKVNLANEDSMISMDFSDDYQNTEEEYRSMMEISISLESLYSYTSNQTVSYQNLDSISVAHGEVGETYIMHRLTPKGNRCRPGICHSEGDAEVANIRVDFEKSIDKNTRGFSVYNYDDYGAATYGRSHGQEAPHSDFFPVIPFPLKPKTIGEALSVIHRNTKRGSVSVLSENDHRYKRANRAGMLSCGQEVRNQWV